MPEDKAEGTPAVVEASKVEDAPAPVETPAAAPEEPAPAAIVETAAEVTTEDKDVKGDEAKTDPVEIKTVNGGLLGIRPHGILQ